MSTISRDNEISGKKKFRFDSKFWARVLVVVISLSMLVGTFYYVIAFAMMDSRVEAVSAVEEESDLLIRVALVYGDSVTVDYLTVADCGFSLGFTDSNNQFTEILTTPVTKLNVARNRNLTLSGTRYKLASKESDTQIGSYHMKASCDKDALETFLNEAETRFPDVNVFPAYENGTYCLMLGHYASLEKAEDALSKLIAEISPETEPETTVPEITAPDTDVTAEASDSVSDSPQNSTVAVETADSTVGETNVLDTTAASDETESEPPAPLDPLTELLLGATVSHPSDTALVFLDQATNTIVWKADQPDGSAYPSARALQSGAAYSYIRGYIGTTERFYDDILEFSAYTTDDYYGVKVINVLPLDTYVGGVIPWEISNKWPLETQKAFAIAVRSYAVYNLGRHKKSYNADVCCTSDCQVYKGFASTNARVRQALTETKGMIAVYNKTGDPCIATYSSSTGGCTANAWEVWGSSRKTFGYLSAVPTPWEKYENYGNGSWTSTATGKQLYDRLEAKGYTALTGSVTKIEITALGENSTYVTAIKFYDAAGHTVEVKQGNKVKSLLSAYVKSGNFVVAKAGENVTRTNYTMLGFGAVPDKKAEGVAVKTNPFDYVVLGRQPFRVLTANGAFDFDDGAEERVATANGVQSFNMSKALDALYYPTIDGVNGQKLPDIKNLDVIIESETLTAEGPSGSFVFIGRGWGHGVGLSQWGAKDLGDMGYDYLTIFQAYYSDVSLVNIHEYLNGTA